MSYNTKIDKNGIKYYYLNDELHREDGPAIEFPNGIKIWFKNNKRHREDGPAREAYNGKEWYKHGKLHRLDGPAVEHSDGYKAWCLNGSYYGNGNDFTNESWIRFVKTLIFR